MPYCENCGSQVNPNAKFCHNCGAPVNAELASSQPAPAQTPSYAPLPSSAMQSPVQAMPEEAKIALLQELIKDAKDQIRNGSILDLVGLLFAFSGFFFYATGLLGFSLACLAFVAGAAMVIAGFYVMIRADVQEGKWKRQLGNVTPSTVKSPEPEPSADNDEYFEHPADNDEYFNENYENWKNLSEEDKE